MRAVQRLVKWYAKPLDHMTKTPMPIQTRLAIIMRLPMSSVNSKLMYLKLTKVSTSVIRKGREPMIIAKVFASDDRA